jgi:catechol 2,3-dioxygenase-like lactoylglutathione lyase family enzyme
LITEFLELERQRVGWRFWVLWVLATNAGFFPGLALGNRLSASAAEPYASAIVGGSFGALVGVAQWLVLRRHIAPSHHWVTGTAIGWCVGAGVGSLILTQLDPSLSPGGVIWTICLGFFAGAVVGIPQHRVLHRFGPALSRCWVPISSLAWGVFFPGAISGVFLARRMSSDSAIQWSQASPVYPVADVDASIEWYRRIFGFEPGHVNSAPGGSNYAVLHAGEIALHLLREDQAPHGLRKPVQTQFWIRGDLDAFFAEVKGRGARVVDPPEDRPWGHRDFMVADPDGNLVWVTSPLSPPEE